jgi:histidyl-tRNA synthetase
VASSKTQPARGMRDFLPADVRRREYVIGVIKEVYERYGFEPLETPAVENIETLIGKYGEEGNQLIFKILKRGVHETSGIPDLALRYDLTVPLARVVAEYQNDLQRVFKRYQIQPVWRADRPARGRFREFYQCDVDILGSRSLVAEAEICAAASDVLIELGFEHFMIHLNHRQLLTSMLETLGIPNAQQATALASLDKLDKIGPEGVRKEFVQKELSEIACSELLDLFSRIDSYAVNVFDLASDSTLHWNPEEFWRWNVFIVGEVNQFIGNSELGRHALEDLTAILRSSAGTSAGRHLVLSPNLARGLSYYTGAIMEISTPGLRGSLGGGGRYDNLVGMFSKREVPACGFSLGLERILYVMTEESRFPENLTSSSADVLIGILDEESIPIALGLARELRQIGRVDVYPDCEPKNKQLFAYAEVHGIRLLIIIGPTEREANQVILRDLTLRQQQTLPIQHIFGEVREKLNAQPETFLDEGSF